MSLSKAGSAGIEELISIMPYQKTVWYDTNQMVLLQSLMRHARSFSALTVKKGSAKLHSLVAEMLMITTVFQYMGLRGAQAHSAGQVCVRLM